MFTTWCSVDLEVLVPKQGKFPLGGTITEVESTATWNLGILRPLTKEATEGTQY